MKSTLIFVLALSIIGMVQSQTWAGTYKADSSCSTSSCCCLIGQVVVTSSSTNVYAVSSSVSGVCWGLTTFIGTAYTSGYTGWMLVGGDKVTLALSSDSSTITVTSSVLPICSGKGVKSNGIKQHSNIIVMFVLTLFGRFINISKN